MPANVVGLGTKFIYLDSLVYEDLCKEPDIYHRVTSYIENNNLVVMVTDAVLAEKHRAEFQQSQIYRFWKEVNAALIEPAGARFKFMCMEWYPAHCRLQVLGRFGDFPRDWSKEFWSERLVPFLSERLVSVARDNLGKPLFAADFNFPKGGRSRYSLEQIWDFTDAYIKNTLRAQFPFSLASLRLDCTFPLRKDAFSSLRIHAGLAYLRYYVGRRTPKLSDLGDQLHSCYLPFCHEIVIEKDQASLVRQLQRSCPQMFLPCKPVVFTKTEFLKHAATFPGGSTS